MRRRRSSHRVTRADDPAALAERVAALTATLLELRRAALDAAGAPDAAAQVALIDAVLAGDDEAYVRTLPGGVSLPPGQRRALIAVLSLTRRSGGTPPTIEALAREQRVSKSTAYGLLEALRARGLIRRERYRHRSATVVGTSRCADGATPARYEDPPAPVENSLSEQLAGPDGGGRHGDGRRRVTDAAGADGHT